MQADGILMEAHCILNDGDERLQVLASCRGNLKTGIGEVPVRLSRETGIHCSSADVPPDPSGTSYKTSRQVMSFVVETPIPDMHVPG